MEYFDFARSFLCACKQAAQHYRACACAQSLDNVSRIFDTSVGDYALAEFIGLVCAIHNCCDLRYADACDNSSRTDRTWTDTHFDYVRAASEQRLCSLCGRYVACHYRQVAKLSLDLCHAIKYALRMSVSRIYNYEVDLAINKRRHSVHYVCCHAHCRAGKKSAAAVLCAVRIFDSLLYIFYCDKSFEITLLIDKRQLLYSALCQYLLSLLQSRTYGSGDKIFFGHAIADKLCHVSLKSQISVGDYAHQSAVDCDRYAAYLKSAHKIVGVFQSIVGTK